MTFADTLKQTLGPRRAPTARKALTRALLGLAGLCALPFLSGSGSFSGQSLRVLIALALACGLAFYVLRLLARRQAAAPASPLRVVARTSLSQRNSLAIVEADGQRFFIAYGDGFTELLAAGSNPVSKPAPEVAGGSR